MFCNGKKNTLKIACPPYKIGFGGLTSGLTESHEANRGHFMCFCKNAV